MPVHDYHCPPIRIRVADRRIGASVFAQFAALDALVHLQRPKPDEFPVALRVRVEAEGLNADGTVAGPAVGEGLQPYFRTLKCDNDTLVLRADGTIVAGRRPATADEPAETPEEWQARAEAFPADTMYQAKYFYWARDTQAMRLAPDIEGHIRMADALGYFKQPG